jgi:ParB-like chromosome segregation protein Spo0J
MHIKDRIIELRRVKASDLARNPKNWRTHSNKQQDALKGILADVGFADALLARETPDGLVLIDGHLRAETCPDQEIPCLVLDVTAEEADKLLAVVDPIAAMAGTDKDALESLLQDIRFDSEALTNMLDGLAAKNGIGIELDDGTEFDESIANDVDYQTCPKCGHKF